MNYLDMGNFGMSQPGQATMGSSIATPSYNFDVGRSLNPAAALTGADTGMMGRFNAWLKDNGVVGTAEQPGWGGLALGAANFGANMFMGMKQYGLAKDQLAEGKRQFAMNFDAQRKTTNAALEDRQRSRVNSSTAGTYESSDSYMNRNRIA